MLRSFIKLRRFGAVPILALLGAPQSVAAQAIPTPITPVRYSIRPASLVALGVLTVVAAAPTLADTLLPYARCAPCDSSRLPGIDRSTVGIPRTQVARISDATLLLTTLGAGALVALTRQGEHDSRAAAAGDVVVLAQAAQVGGLASQWIKVIVHRPRPVRYTSDAPLHANSDNGRSFPSGHATMSFAAATAAISILHRRGELGDHAVPAVMLLAGATATSSLRVGARRHFPTDVIAGAVLGTAIGWLVPRLQHAH